MAGPVDYYEVLQVSPNADEEVIQAAYKRLALKWHPDRRPGDPSAPERMQLLNAAYAVLSDPKKRKAYDARRARPTVKAVAAESTHGEAESRESAPSPARHRRRTAARYFHEASRVQHVAAWYVAISLADVLMTYLLLRAGPHFYESNPVARWFFHRWNILGMTLFKFALVGAVVAVSEVIERGRPGWGRLVLLAGCGATGYALVRGLRLLVGLDD